jgi:hypothetical protein
MPISDDQTLAPQYVHRPINRVTGYTVLVHITFLSRQALPRLELTALDLGTNQVGQLLVHCPIRTGVDRGNRAHTDPASS